jgi:hypothetical protein
MYNQNMKVRSIQGIAHYIQRMSALPSFGIVLWGSRSNIFPDLELLPYREDMFSCIPDLRLKDFLKNK